MLHDPAGVLCRDTVKQVSGAGVYIVNTPSIFVIMNPVTSVSRPRLLASLFVSVENVAAAEMLSSNIDFHILAFAVQYSIFPPCISGGEKLTFQLRINQLASKSSTEMHLEALLACSITGFMTED